MVTKQHRAGSSTALRVVCTVLFCAFAFLYVFFYLADNLAVTQHVLSDGATSYNRTIGAIVITVTFILLQVVVHRLTHHGLFSYALTFFPSMTLLGLLSVICERVLGGQGLLLPTIIAIVAIALWVVVMVVASKMLVLQPESAGLFSRPMSINLLLMVLMMIAVGIGCGGDERAHYRSRIEVLLLKEDYEEALRVGELSGVRDKHITQLRMFALAKLDMAGEVLFTYPIGGTGADLIPSVGDLLIFSADSIVAFADSIPCDYVLCAHLIDRDIDAFAQEVTRWYEVNDSLPKHYREALTLYTHLRSEPIVTYHNVVMDTDYDDLQALEHQYRNRHEASRPVYSQYKGTYWWYYNYE